MGDKKLVRYFEASTGAYVVVVINNRFRKVLSGLRILIVYTSSRPRICTNGIFEGVKRLRHRLVVTIRVVA